MALIKSLHLIGNLIALICQAHANRTTVSAGTLMMDKAHLDQLFEIIRDIRAQIIAARTQFASCQF
ncbi:hypothetical protein D3C81_1914050 [compost metagenome]